jgi:hypothetical protein
MAENRRIHCKISTIISKCVRQNNSAPPRWLRHESGLLTIQPGLARLTAATRPAVDCFNDALDSGDPCHTLDLATESDAASHPQKRRFNFVELSHIDRACSLPAQRCRSTPDVDSIFTADHLGGPGVESLHSPAPSRGLARSALVVALAGPAAINRFCQVSNGIYSTSPPQFGAISLMSA